MVLRIGGLASGMDIDSLVEEMMNAQRIPLDKINQKKTYTEWQRDDYREINTMLLDFDTSIFDGISRQASYIKKTVTVSDSDSLSVKNLNSTIDFAGSIKINNLAKAATMKSNGETAITDSTKKLSEFNVSAQTITIQTVKKDGTLQSASESFSYTIDPTTDTLDSVIAKINKDSGVTAFYDSTTKQISFTAKNTGDVSSDAEIKLTGSFFTDTLKLDADNAVANTNGRGTLGENASFTYNGLTTTRPSNTFTINGVEFTAKKVTAEDVTFSSTPDVDSILDTITQFVDKYNEIVEKVRTKLNETKNRDYTPLTDAQKEEMSEDEIEKWEELAKSGTLKNDSILSSLLTKMRTNISSPVSGTSTYNKLSDIGITTTSNYLDGGKLTIDEDKLREIIQADPNAVYELFQKNGDGSSEQGIARRLRDNLKIAMTDITAKAGKSSSVNNTFTLGKLLINYDDQISRFEEKLESLETRYWKQFTAMETAISKANSQSSYLTNMFSYS